MEFCRNSDIFYQINVQKHVLTTYKNFFSHWHKCDNTSNCASALHLCNIISAPALRLRKLTFITELESQLPKCWSENEVDTCRSLLMTTKASGLGWSYIPYQCQFETSLIVQFLNLWKTAYCQFARLIIVFSCKQMQGWLHRGTCLLFRWSTALVCPIKMPSVHSISMLATYGIKCILLCYLTCMLVAKFSVLTRGLNWNHQATKWAHVEFGISRTKTRAGEKPQYESKSAYKPNKLPEFKSQSFKQVTLFPPQVSVSSLYNGKTEK